MWGIISPSVCCRLFQSIQLKYIISSSYIWRVIKIPSFWKISGMREWFIFSMMFFSATHIKRENVYPLTTFPHFYHPLVPSNNAFTEWDILLVMKIYSIHLCVSGLMHGAWYLPRYPLSSISGFSFYGYKYQMCNAIYTCFFWTFSLSHILTQCDKWFGKPENAYFSSSFFHWHFTKKLISRIDVLFFVHKKAPTTVDNVLTNLHPYKENFRISRRH